MVNILWFIKVLYNIPGRLPTFFIPSTVWSTAAPSTWPSRSQGRGGSCQLLVPPAINSWWWTCPSSTSRNGGTDGWICHPGIIGDIWRYTVNNPINTHFCKAYMGLINGTIPMVAPFSLWWDGSLLSLLLVFARLKRMFWAASLSWWEHSSEPRMKCRCDMQILSNLRWFHRTK